MDSADIRPDFAPNAAALGQYLRGRRVYWWRDNTGAAHLSERCGWAGQEDTTETRMQSGSVDRAVREGRMVCSLCLAQENAARGDQPDALLRGGSQQAAVDRQVGTAGRKGYGLTRRARRASRLFPGQSLDRATRS